MEAKAGAELLLQRLQQVVPPYLQQVVCKKLPVKDLTSGTLLCLVLALPHFLYAFVWLRPRVWQHIFGSKSVDVFVTCGFMGKVLQLGAVLLWAWANQADGLCVLSSVTMDQFVGAAVLGALGQALNVGTFRALGREGVYYGARLGAKVPWCHGWPFCFVPHPQYVGSVMSLWAALWLLWDMLPQPDAPLVACWWTALYVVTAVQESLA